MHFRKLTTTLTITAACAYPQYAHARTETIAVEGTQAPGQPAGVLFGDDLGLPVINATGNIAHTSNLSGTGITADNDQAIYENTTLVVQKGDPAHGTPAGVVYSQLGDPLIRDSSNLVTYHAFLTGTGITTDNDEGIWREGFFQSLIVREGNLVNDDPPLAPDVIFQSGSFPDTFTLNAEDGFPYYTTGLSGTGINFANNQAIFASTSLRIQKGDVAPGTGGALFGSLGTPNVDKSRNIAHKSFLAIGGAVNGFNNEGIWRDDTLIAREGSQAPGTPAGTTFSFLGNPSIATNIAVHRSLVDGPGVTTDNDQGIWAEDTLIAREGDQAAGFPDGVNYRSLGTPVSNDLGQVAHQSNLQTGPIVSFANDAVIMRGDTIIAREGSPAGGVPGAIFHFSLGDPVLNNIGVVAHESRIDNAGVNNQGIWLSDGIDQVLAVRKGDTLEGKTVSFMNIHDPATVSDGNGSPLNDRGELAYHVQFDDGTEGIFRFTPTLHWRNPANTGNWDDAQNWTLGILPAFFTHDVVIDPDHDVNIQGPTIGTSTRPQSITIGGGFGNATVEFNTTYIDPASNLVTVNRNAHLILQGDSSIDTNNIDLGTTPATPLDQPATLTIIGPTADIDLSSTINVAVNAPATLNATNATYAYTENLNVGINSHGTLNVLTDADAEVNTDAIFGVNDPATGHLNVDGSGSTILFTAPVTFGLNGDAHLNATNGGVVNADDGITLATSATSTASLNAHGPATQINSGNLTIADAGHATATIQAAAKLDSAATQLALLPGSAATMTVTDPGTTFTPTILNVAKTGTATLNVENHATLNPTNTTTLAGSADSIATLNVDNATANFNTLVIAQEGTATANFQSATTDVSGFAVVANKFNAQATLNINDTQFTADNLIIADQGMATTDIQAATAFINGATTLASEATATANLTAKDSNITTNTLTIASRGMATADIQSLTITINGLTTLARETGSTADLTAKDTTFNTDALIIADKGTATFTATGNTNVNATGPITLGLTKGAGNGTLNINDNATVTTPDKTTVNAPGALNINGGTLTTDSINGTGPVNFNAGTINIATPGTFTINKTQFGTNLTLNENHKLTATDKLALDSSMNLAVEGATITADSLTNNGSISFDHGTIAAPSGVVNQGDIQLGSTTAAKIQTPQLSNQGTLAGPGRITGDLNNSDRINLTGGTLRADGLIINLSLGLILGNGTLQANAITNQANMAFSGPTNILGDVTNNPTGTIVSSAAGPLTFFDDVTNDGQIRTNTGGFTVFLGTTSGSGIYTGTGTVINEADFTPGSSPGINTFAGNLTFGPFATLEIEAQATVTAPVAGTDHDQLTIANTLTLDGTLNVVALPDAGPIQDTPLGNNYLAITYGTRTPGSYFHTINGTFINTAFALAPILDDTAKTFTLRATIPGDLNLDNKVSVADLAEFALNFDTAPGLHNETDNQSSWLYGDFNTDGQITVADLSLLALNFGFDATDPTATPTPLSITDAAILAGLDPTTIPEPATIFTLTAVFAFTTTQRPRKKQPIRTTRKQ